MSGLRWGDYLGSPADSVEPKLAVNEVIGAQQIVSVTTGEIIGLTESTCVITHEVKSGMYLLHILTNANKTGCEVCVSSLICNTTSRQNHMPQQKFLKKKSSASLPHMDIVIGTETHPTAS